MKTSADPTSSSTLPTLEGADEDPAVRQPRRGFMDVIIGALLRPELTAVLGAIVVFVFFAVTAGEAGFVTTTGTQNYLEVAAEVGIIAAAWTLLLIAGEFDLSVGSMMAAGAIVSAYALVELELPLIAAIPIAFVAALAVASFNWLFVVRFGLPSFIVTLGTLFAIAGGTLVWTRAATDTTLIFGVKDAVGDDPLRWFVDGSLFGVSIVVAWWVFLTVLAAWILNGTRFGNWVFATGGDQDAARRAGVPVMRVKWQLFSLVSVAAAFVGILASFQVDSAEVTMGQMKEFQVATAVVIGGTLIYGGSGSPIGTFFGALLFGMLNQGFFFTNLDDEWFQAFLGGMLVGAAFINTYVRRYALKRQARP